MYSHFQKQPKYDVSKPSVRISSAYVNNADETYRKEQNKSKALNISKQNFRPYSSCNQAMQKFETKNYDSSYEETPCERITSFRPKVDKSKFVVN